MKKILFYSNSGEVFAINYNVLPSNGLFLGYVKDGQHVEIHKDYIKESKKHNKNNKLILPLILELKTIGY
jgi:hypothetical protein